MIDIAFCFNDYLYRNVCVTITSLLIARKKSSYRIHVFYYGNDFDEITLKQIVSYLDPYSEIIINRITNSYLGACTLDHIDEATYSKLRIPELLSELDKVIYSDVDIIFCDDLEEMWNEDISGKYILSVKDQINIHKNWDECSEKYDYWDGMIKGEYINAGIIVMNLKEIREDISLVKKWKEMPFEGYHYLDQDIVNLSCAGKVGTISLKYNFPGTPWFLKHLREAVDDGVYGKDEYEDALKKATVIHYLGSAKPWSNDVLTDYYLIWRDNEKEYEKVIASMD